MSESGPDTDMSGGSLADLEAYGLLVGPLLNLSGGSAYHINFNVEFTG